MEQPDNQPPGHLGLPGLLPHPTDAERFWVVVQGFGIFETGDGGGSWQPRNHGLRADWPLEDPEIGYCVHKLVMSPTDTDRLYQQNHCGEAEVGRQALGDLHPRVTGVVASVHRRNGSADTGGRCRSAT